MSGNKVEGSAAPSFSSPCENSGWRHTLALQSPASTRQLHESKTLPYRYSYIDRDVTCSIGGMLMVKTEKLSGCISEGCPPVREDRYIVSYPDAIVTSEDSSPPLTYLKESHISFFCQVQG